MTRLETLIMKASFALAPLLTLAVAIWSYGQRGYFAIGGEYGFLFVPFFVYCIIATNRNGR